MLIKKIFVFKDVQVQVVQPISDEKTRFANRNIPEAILR
jgi:hypothetical protein